MMWIEEGLVYKETSYPSTFDRVEGTDDVINDVIFSKFPKNRE